MYQLALMICLMVPPQPQCTAGITDKLYHQEEPCKKAGEELAKKLSFELMRQGVPGQVGYSCQQAEAA